MEGNGYGAKEMELGLEFTGGGHRPFDAENQSTFYVGKRGGKTSTITRLALDQIYDFEPVVFIGNIQPIIDRIPKKRLNDVILFAPALYPFAFNVLSGVPAHIQPLYASVLLDAVKGAWGYDSPTPTLDQYVRGGLQTLLAVPGTSIVDLKFLLTSQGHRKYIKGYLKDFVLKDFWDDFETLTDKEKRQDTSSTLNKIRAIIFDPLMRECLDKKTNRLTFTNKIVLVSLNEAEMGRENARLMGALVLAQLYIDGVQGLDTTLYIDDAYRYGTNLLDMIITACPLVKIHLTAQYLGQFKKTLQPSILSVDRIVAFRTTVQDSKTIGDEFPLTAGQFKLHEIKQFEAYVERDYKAVKLEMFEHDYEKTYYTENIIKRCVEAYTEPETNRIERFKNDRKH